MRDEEVLVLREGIGWCLFRIFVCCDMNVVVLVLGDVGRSPRMQYHCMSLAESDWVNHVTLIGTRGQPCIDQVESSGKIEQKLLKPPVTGNISRKLFLLYAPVKIVQQICQLFFALASVKDLDCILIQNPPCIPTFAVVALVKFFKGSGVVIDWHNLGFTILGLSLRGGESNILVRIAKIYEKVFGYYVGDGHLTVTKAMKGYLVDSFGLLADDIAVQYDKAPNMFHRMSLDEQHELFERVSKEFYGSNCFTRKSTSGKIENHPDRPFLIVSSTSWTPDEDFGILLNALVVLDKSPRIKSKKILCVVTGKGPQKEMYLAKIDKLGLQHVLIKTIWLEAEDYPKLLGSADLGVCLHTSSSNLDLPMKVVDMYGSGLPVCAYDYECLSELVQDGLNGLVFKTEVELAAQLASLVLDPGCEELLSKLRAGVCDFSKKRWREHWLEETSPVIKRVGKRSKFPMVAILFVIMLVEACLYFYWSG
mmetsp:Transcript_24987/g.40554  ORF Transcript_24987/g.40554 Transcript_24987/m.40554 type:complete len:479 (-) Transcript_24987:1775-3211(-)